MLETLIIILTLLSFPLVAIFARGNGRKINHEIEYFTLGLKDRGTFAISAGISMAFVGGAATINMAWV